MMMKELRNVFAAAAAGIMAAHMLLPAGPDGSAAADTTAALPPVAKQRLSLTPDTHGGRNFLKLGWEASQPIGHVEFCNRMPEECKTYAVNPQRVMETGDALAQLVNINDEVNNTITPTEDQLSEGETDHWAYPDDGKGDCEDYVLLKRKKLMELGWPASALLIAVVKTPEKNEDHAVLLARTSRADYVLDNLSKDVKTWRETPYKWEKAQSPFYAAYWLKANP